MIRESKENAKDVLKGNLGKITGFYTLVSLEYILPFMLTLLISFNTISNILTGDIGNPMPIMLLCILFLLFIMTGCVFTLLYGVIHLNEYSELPKFTEATKKGYSRFFRKFFALILLNIIIQLGFCLFYIPGIILSLALSFTTFMLVDEDFDDYSLFELMKESFSLTNGYKMELFKLGLSLLPKIFLLVILAFVLQVTIICPIFVYSYMVFYVLSAQYNMYKMIKEETYIDYE